MCGIGIIAPRPGSGLPTRALARHLLLNLAPRGRDAAGVAWKRLDGSTLYRKAQGHPGKLAGYLANPGGSRSLDDSQAVILHTRWATLGDPADQANNHPIIRTGVALVHNGIVENAKSLYRVAKASQEAVVDSDSLAALVQTAADHETLLARLGKVRGAAAIAWLETTDDPRDRSTLWLARIDTRPLVIGWTAEGDCIGASTTKMLHQACRAAQVQLEDTLNLPEGTVLRLKDGDIDEWYDIGTGSGVAESTVEYGKTSMAAAPALKYDPEAWADIDEWLARDFIAGQPD